MELRNSGKEIAEYLQLSEKSVSRCIGRGKKLVALSRGDLKKGPPFQIFQLVLTCLQMLCLVRFSVPRPEAEKIGFPFQLECLNDTASERSGAR
jgi:hypothetical protein